MRTVGVIVVSVFKFAVMLFVGAFLFLVRLAFSWR